jgi:uncharacterized membrane protein
MRRFGWALMMVLAMFIALYAVTLVVWPAPRAPFLRDRFATIPLAATLHLLGAAIALGVGSFQHNARVRNGSLPRHRWLGRAYVIGVLLGGVAAFVMALVSQGGLPTHLGFGLLAILWLGTTAKAYVSIRAGDQERHREWMTRSFALTYAAVMLRIYLPLSQMVGIPFEPAYQAISWLCWVPNLVLAEWIILRRREANLLEQRAV